MAPPTIASLVASSRPSGGDDRVAVFDCLGGDATILVLADGAGGTGAGARAAEALVSSVRGQLALPEPLDPAVWLARADAAVALATAGAGETTGIVVVLAADQLVGASVGDSEAWLVGDDAIVRLTDGQVAKPLLGSGAVVVTPFAARRTGTLVVGSDGLFKYTSAARVAAVVRATPPAELPARLVDLVRLRSGALPDDVAVLVAGIE